MTVFEGLTYLTQAAPRLRAWLVSLAANPDLKAEAERELAALDAAVSAANLAELGAVIPKELLNISQGKLDGRRHPSDA